MKRTAIVRITEVKEKGHKDHYWFFYKNEDGIFRYMVTFKVKNGVIIMKNHSVGVTHSCYANIDGTGSLAGMRANHRWKNDAVVRAHGCYFNLSKESMHNPIEAVLHLLKNKFNFDIKGLVNREFILEYDYHEAVITTIKEYKDEPINTKQLLKL